MTHLSLRPYQIDAIARTQAAYRSGVRSVLLQMPCGAGKTSTAAGGIIAPSVALGRRVVFVADLEELIDDTAARLRALSLPVGIVKAGRASDPTAPVQVASLQTLARRMGDLPPGDRIILDEAHIAGARTVRDVLGHYRGGLVLGLSATPCRGDGQPLDEFDRLVVGPSVLELIACGALVRTQVFAPDRVLERGVARDPVELVLSDRMDRRCVIFAPTGAESVRIARDLTDAGHSTLAVLDGMGRDDRARVRDQLASGAVRSLTTVRALQKGFDAPVLDCAILTTLGSAAGTIQSEGRVQRPSPGKAFAIVDDLRGASWLWGLPEDARVWSLEGSQGRPVRDPALSTRRCRACDALFSGDRTRCPREGCGAILVSHERALKVQAAEMFNASGMGLEERAGKYRASIERKLIAGGKSAFVAAKIASRAVPPWERKASA